MEVHKRLVAKVFLLSLSLNIVTALPDNTYATTQISSSECYDNYGQPRVSCVISHRRYSSDSDSFREWKADSCVFHKIEISSRCTFRMRVVVWIMFLLHFSSFLKILISNKPAHMQTQVSIFDNINDDPNINVYNVFLSFVRLKIM